MENLLGQGRAAIDLIVDEGSLPKTRWRDSISCDDYGPGAVVGSARINGEICTTIANDAMTFNPASPSSTRALSAWRRGIKWRWRSTVRWRWIKTNRLGKRPLVLIVDTPGMGRASWKRLSA